MFGYINDFQMLTVLLYNVKYLKFTWLVICELVLVLLV